MPYCQNCGWSVRGIVCQNCGASTNLGPPQHRSYETHRFSYSPQSHHQPHHFHPYNQSEVGILGLILGIMGLAIGWLVLFVGIILGVSAIVFGGIAMTKHQRYGEMGVVLGVLSIVISITVGLLLWLIVFW